MAGRENAARYQIDMLDAFDQMRWKWQTCQPGNTGFDPAVVYLNIFEEQSNLHSTEQSPTVDSVRDVDRHRKEQNESVKQVYG
jgi:hypothetical protein